MGRCVSGGLDFGSCVARPSSASRGVSAMVTNDPCGLQWLPQGFGPVGADFEVVASAAPKGWWRKTAQSLPRGRARRSSCATQAGQAQLKCWNLSYSRTPTCLHPTSLARELSITGCVLDYISFAHGGSQPGTPKYALPSYCDSALLFCQCCSSAGHKSIDAQARGQLFCVLNTGRSSVRHGD